MNGKSRKDSFDMNITITSGKWALFVGILGACVGCALGGPIGGIIAGILGAIFGDSIEEAIIEQTRR